MFLWRKTNLVSIRSLIEECPTLINEADQNGNTPIHFAAAAGNVELIQYLLDQNAEIDRPNNWRRTPLSVAVEFGGPRAVELLLERGANKDAPDSYGWTPLFVCSCPETTLLLLRYGANVNASSEGYCETPLLFAIKYGRTRIAEILIRHGAQVNAVMHTTDQEQLTPLLLAALGNNVKITKLLLRSGANGECQNEGGRTPLVVAAMRGHANIVQALVAHGVNINAISQSDQSTALHWAARQGHTMVARYLINHGASLDLVDKHKRTARAVAAEYDCHGVVLAIDKALRRRLRAFFLGTLRKKSFVTSPVATLPSDLLGMIADRVLKL